MKMSTTERTTGMKEHYVKVIERDTSGLSIAITRGSSPAPQVALPWSDVLELVEILLRKAEGHYERTSD
jgi:hypothetical protein